MNREKQQKDSLYSRSSQVMSIPLEINNTVPVKQYYFCSFLYNISIISKNVEENDADRKCAMLISNKKAEVLPTLLVQRAG